MPSAQSKRIPLLAKEEETRYWELVQKQANERGCWLWTGSANSKGYGRFWVQGRHYFAHRISWQLAGRDANPDLMICHTCDTPLCVNPTHLMMADAATNNRDAKLKRNLVAKRATDMTKPRRDYPLTPRGDGRWCKRVHGKLHYFRGTAQEALDEWNRVKDDLIAGREPRAKEGSLNLCDLVNQFLHHKKLRLDSKELAPITWQGYEAVGKLLVGFFGRTYPAEQLRSSDFQRLRAHLAQQYGPVTLGNRINVVRMVFKYGHKAGLLAKAAEFSVEFDKPSAKTLRQVRAAKGERLFTAEQIKKLLKKADSHMRAMILLAINGGLGNTDLALLPLGACDLEKGWLDYPRPKTGMPRRVPLWPETVAAVKLAKTKRRLPKNPEDANLLFIGRLGSSYASETGGHRVAHEFSKLCENAGVQGRVFYDLRRTFQTIADNLSRDRDGVKALMGHAPASGDMSAVYRQGFDDDRLRSIVDHVHRWLYAKPAAVKKAAPKKPKAVPARREKQRERAALRVVG